MSESSATPRRMTLLSLCATTFFIVSGGPYGLEEIVLGHGYARTLLLLLLVPLIWALPVALLVGELGSALPETGGYYAWVRRGCGPFWGLQEGWLSIATSLFDMAIYPTLFVTYLGRVWPSLIDVSIGKPGWFVGVSMIAVCAGWNVLGTRAVGVGATLLGFFLIAPFLVVFVLALSKLPHGGYQQAETMLSMPAPPSEGGEGSSAFIAGVMICMWNYMGWDNASTIAGEVIAPQRNYPRAMLLTLAVVIVVYTLPTLAGAVSGLPPEEWSAGSWVEVARRLGGPSLAWLVVIGGAICAFGMFNALILSCSRLPVALAEDGYFPRALARRNPRSNAPTTAIVIASTLYAACMGLGLRRLMEIDVMLYGASLVLEFVALVALRLREPTLPRPFKIGGGLPVVIALSILPTGLLVVAVYQGRNEPGMLGMTSLQLALSVMAVGPLWWCVDRVRRGRIRPAEGASRGTNGA